MNEHTLPLSSALGAWGLPGAALSLLLPSLELETDPCLCVFLPHARRYLLQFPKYVGCEVLPDYLSPINRATPHLWG